MLEHHGDLVRDAVLGCCCPALAGCRLRAWRGEHLQCAAAGDCRGLAGVARWRGLGDLILSAASAAGMASPAATAAWALQGAGQEKPARSRLQIIVRSLWSPSGISCWDPGGLTGRGGNEVETRAPGKEEKHKILWRGYCGTPIWSLPSVSLWGLPSSTALDAGWEMAHGWIQEWEAT